MWWDNFCFSPNPKLRLRFKWLRIKSTGTLTIIIIKIYLQTMDLLTQFACFPMLKKIIYLFLLFYYIASHIQVRSDKFSWFILCNCGFVYDWSLNHSLSLSFSFKLFLKSTCATLFFWFYFRFKLSNKKAIKSRLCSLKKTTRFLLFCTREQNPKGSEVLTNT